VYSPGAVSTRSVACPMTHCSPVQNFLCTVVVQKAPSPEVRCRAEPMFKLHSAAAVLTTQIPFYCPQFVMTSFSFAQDLSMDCGRGSVPPRRLHQCDGTAVCIDEPVAGERRSLWDTAPSALHSVFKADTCAAVTVFLHPVLRLLSSVFLLI
jgi:hypothetical protein